MTTLRLVKAYRGYRAGDVIRVPDGLAARLREAGLAHPETHTLFRRQETAERSVSTPASAEQRTH